MYDVFEILKWYLFFKSARKRCCYLVIAKKGAVSESESRRVI